MDQIQILEFSIFAQNRPLPKLNSKNVYFMLFSRLDIALGPHRVLLMKGTHFYHKTYIYLIIELNVGCFMDNVYYYLGDLTVNRQRNFSSAEECQDECLTSDDCNFWTWLKPGHRLGGTFCLLKKSLDYQKIDPLTISGPKYCPSKAKSPFDMPMTTATIPPIPSPTPKGCYEDNLDYYLGDLTVNRRRNFISAEQCQAECQYSDGCNYWTWLKPGHPFGGTFCFLKSRIDHRRSDTSTLSGPKHCLPTARNETSSSALASTTTVTTATAMSSISNPGTSETSTAGTSNKPTSPTTTNSIEQTTTNELTRASNTEKSAGYFEKKILVPLTYVAIQKPKD